MLYSKTIFREYHENVNDANEIVKSGIYHLYAGSLHTPNDGGGWLVIHFNSDKRALQLALYNNNIFLMYGRFKWSGSDVFGDWKKLFEL